MIRHHMAGINRSSLAFLAYFYVSSHKTRFHNKTAYTLTLLYYKIHPINDVNTDVYLCMHVYIYIYLYGVDMYMLNPYLCVYVSKC